MHNTGTPAHIDDKNLKTEQGIILTGWVLLKYPFPKIVLYILSAVFVCSVNNI